MKLNEDGVRLCDSQDCEFPAMYTLVWTNEWQVCCLIHANQLLGIAAVMEHKTPIATVRKLTADEMLPERTNTDDR